MRNRKLVSDGLIAEVKRLRSEGLSYRNIKDGTGVSRTNIAAIVNGFYNPPVKRVERPKKPPVELFDKNVVAFCKKCGCDVHPPCLACKIRSLNEKPNEV